MAISDHAVDGARHEPRFLADHPAASRISMKEWIDSTASCRPTLDAAIPAR